jgi:cobalt-zinc-cadmium efflux system outer membrane protein
VKFFDSRALAASTVATILTGCATLDPAVEYQRSSEYVEIATGVPDAVAGERDALVVDAYIEAALEGNLTSREAVEIALLNNADLQAAFLDIGIARANLVQSGLLSNPSLAMAFRLPAGGGLSAIDLDIAQNIADLWQISPRKREAERLLERTVLRIAHQAGEVATMAKEAYASAVGADQRLIIVRENLDVIRATLELSRFRHEAGADNVLDVNLAEGVMLEATLEVQRARLAASDARRELATVLGLSMNAERLSLLDDKRIELRPLDGEALIDAALTHRLDYRALQEWVRAAEARLCMERRRVFPSLEIGLSMERDARGPGRDHDVWAETVRASIDAGRLTAPEPRSRRDSHDDVTLGPGFALELPLLDQNQAGIAEARLLLDQVTRRLLALETNITQEVRGAIDRVETTGRITREYESKLIPRLLQSLELARESYQAGNTAFFTVLEAERAYLSTRDRFAAALAEESRAMAHLEWVVGMTISAMPPALPRERTPPSLPPSD